MKKALTFLLLSANLLLLTACQNEDDNMISSDLVDYNTYSYKLGSYTTTKDTYGYTDSSLGISAVTTTFLTYITDENGIIQEIDIDEVESNIYFDQSGQLANYTEGEVITKKELGDNYGMRSASPIGKEWYEQIDALEDYMVGKNITTFLATPNAKSRSSYNNYSVDNYDYYTKYSNGLPYGYDANNVTGDVVGNARSIDNTENYALEITEDTTSSSIATDSSDTTLDNSASSMPDESYQDESLNPNADSWKTDLTASVTIDTTNIMLALQNAYESNR